MDLVVNLQKAGLAKQHRLIAQTPGFISLIIVSKIDRRLLAHNSMCILMFLCLC